MSKKWWYLRGESELGPFNETEFRLAVKDGRITDETMVKTHRLDTWRPFNEVEVPPSPSQELHPVEGLVFRLPVNDAMLWVLAVFPILVALALATRFRFAPDLRPELDLRYAGIAYLVVTLLVLVVDRAIVRRALARPTNAWWGLALVPVYLFKRRRLSDNNQAPFVLHVVLFVLGAGACGAIAALDVKAATCDDAQVVSLAGTDLAARLNEPVTFVDAQTETDHAWRTWTVRHCTSQVGVEGEETPRTLTYDVTRRWGKTSVEPTGITDPPGTPE